jgi:hypothetical protein
VVTNTTHLAGASGAAISALQVCSHTQFGDRAFQDNLMLANMCRPQNNCQGFLDKALTKVLEARTSANVSGCSGRLWMSITAAKPANQSDKNVLVGDLFGNRSQALAALRLSTYFPGVSGPSATLRLPEMEAEVGPGYDGGFSQSSPCPPGETSVAVLQPATAAVCSKTHHAASSCSACFRCWPDRLHAFAWFCGHSRSAN